MIFLPTSENLKKAATLLQEENIISFPTETVYGLGGLARSDIAVLKIYHTKGRPSYNPLIVHVSSLNQAKTIGVFNGATEKLVSLFWPGPLTVVVPLQNPPKVSSFVTAGLDTVAIRFSSHPILLELLNLVGEPLVAPSANPSGFLTSTTAQHVHKAFPSLFVLEGGACTQGVESTIVQVTDEKIYILRPGAVSREEIEAKMGRRVETIENSQKVSAPGQTLHHYAPTLPLRMNVLCPQEKEAFLGFGKMSISPTLNLSPEGSLEEAAHKLFSFLHQLDNPSHYTGIAVAPLPNTGIGVALNDRLTRAARLSSS